MRKPNITEVIIFLATVVTFMSMLAILVIVPTTL